MAIFVSLVTAAPAAALDTFFAGPRAMGMGGANVASVTDTTAQYYNPAAFGFFANRDGEGKRTGSDNNDMGRKKWGVDLNAGLGYRLHDEFGSFIDVLSDIDLDELSSGVSSQSDLEDLINLVASLEGIDDPDNAITADATAGLGIRAGHFAIGARGFLQASGRVIELDRQNLGFDITGTELENEITAIQVDGFTPAPSGSYDYQFFKDPTQRSQIIAALGGGIEAEQALQKLDFVADQQGIDPELIPGATDLLTTAINNADGTTPNFDDNTTTVLLQGFGVVEIPLSYGYAINDHLAIGANLKVMQGRVYGNRVVVFDDAADDILEETDEKYEETTNFGLDLGIMARFPYVNLGIVGRNLNSPKFDGFREVIILSNGQPVDLSVDDVELKPQVTAGVAFIPFQTLTLEVDYDLTKNETTFAGYDTQNLRFGLEWDAFRFLALRAGAYKNLAEDDIDWVYTAGLGLNFWAMRLDIAGAVTTDKDEFDDDDIPTETRVAAQLSVDF